jgi:2-polyprenyl-3-methyl-5-hydroxy-6-metoxy-1,4-benzoquinol methylase
MRHCDSQHVRSVLPPLRFARSREFCKCSHGALYRFAVKAGAKHVIGVDMSTIIEKAREIVEVNGMSSKITLLQGKMEEVELPFPKVDIIVSEWMGYFLLYESMMDTVLYARDRYLKPDGMIFPDKATIFLAGIEDGEYKEEKIGCKSTHQLLCCSHKPTISQSGTTFGASTIRRSKQPP